MTAQLLTVVKLFPLLLPIWEQRPPTMDELRPGPYPIEATADEIRMLQEGLRISSDYDLRCQMAKDMRKTGRRDAFDALRGRLGKEKHSKVTATILQQLLAMPHDSPDLGKPLPPLLSHPEPDVRYWAVRLCLKARAIRLVDVGRMALEDKDAAVRHAACSVLSGRTREVGIDFFRKLWTAGDPETRAEALAGACAKPKIAACRSELLALCDDEAVAVRHALAANLHKTKPGLRAALARKLAQDPHAGVRGPVAQSIGLARDKALQPVLLRLATDPDAEVRRLAAENLALFPASDTLVMIVRLLGDPRNLVRCQAEETAVIINRDVPVADSVAARLADEFSYARYHACRILGRINARQYDRHLHGRLAKETIPENLGAVIFGLGCVNARFAAADVAAHGRHESPVVRKEVARALGCFQDPTTYDLINALIFDADDDTRQAAIISSGWIGDGKSFSASLLKTLKTFDGRKMTALNRRASCWAAGRLRPVDKKLMSRLVTQATTPVVPVPMGPPEYEDDTVLVSACFALAQCTRDDPSVRERAVRVQKLHMYDPPPGQATAALLSGGMIYSAEVQEFARQARAYMTDEAVEKRPRPTRGLNFQYGKWTPPEQK